MIVVSNAGQRVALTRIERPVVRSTVTSYIRLERAKKTAGRGGLLTQSVFGSAALHLCCAARLLCEISPSALAGAHVIVQSPNHRQPPLHPINLPHAPFRSRLKVTAGSRGFSACGAGKRTGNDRAPSCLRVLAGALAEVAEGRRVAVEPENRELTTSEAADFLNVSRPYLSRLLKERKISTGK